MTKHSDYPNTCKTIVRSLNKMSEVGKRKRNILTFETKLSILDKLSEGASQSRLANK